MSKKNGQRPMLDATDEGLGVSFSYPKAPTVREQMRYRSLIAFGQKGDMYERHWEGARFLIQDWECDALPDPSTDLDELTDPRAANAIQFASVVLAGHMNNLETVEKN